MAVNPMGLACCIRHLAQAMPPKLASRRQMSREFVHRHHSRSAMVTRLQSQFDGGGELSRG